METNPALPGFFGKLPQVGDFVRRGLPGEFLTPWDAWLQQGLLLSRERLAERWLDAYLKGPLWRFALSADLCGPAAWLGVLMPSVDRVGRYFPLTVAGRIPPGTNLFVLADRSDAWFAAIERRMLEALEDEEPRLDALEAALREALPPSGPVAAAVPTDTRAEDPARGVEVPLPEVGQVAAASPDLLSALAGGSCSLWWTAGSEYVEPCLRCFDRLPPPEGFWRFLVADPALASAPETAAP